MAAVVVLDAETTWLRQTALSWDVAFNETVLPALDVVNRAVMDGDYLAALPATAAIMSAYGRAPLFTTMAEFEVWMNHPVTSLTLDPNVAK